MENNTDNINTAKPLNKRGLVKFSLLYNKFLLVTVFFLVWMCFFDLKDIPSNINKREKYNELHKSEQHLNQLITDSRKELDMLKTNAQTIEKYAREKYMMKKDNEDLFIINTLPKNK